MRINYDFKPVLVNKICSISHKMKKPNFRGDFHKHKSNQYEIIFVDYGEIILTSNNRQVKLAPGECVFIPGEENHYMTGKGGIPFNFMNIMFCGKIPSSLLDVKIPVCRNGHELMKKIKGESVQNKMHSNELTACYLTEFIVDICRRQTIDIPGNLPETVLLKSYQSEIVNRAISVISNEYNKPLDLKKVSMAVGISVPHLRALLKKETGESFITILHKQRVATAKHLLCNSNLSFEEIASAVGYSSLPFFFKVFKRSTGMTPKAYASSLGDTQS